MSYPNDKKISIYVHTPFCEKHCGYCSFFVITKSSVWQKMIQETLASTHKQIEEWSKKIEKWVKIKSLYFGWWTPLSYWVDWIFWLYSLINNNYDLSEIQEITIEVNPFPLKENIQNFLKLSQLFGKQKIRLSIWVQSFDDDLLKLSDRDYTFKSFFDWINEIIKLKQEWQFQNVIFNLDYIAFGSQKENLNVLRNDKIRDDKFKNLVDNKVINSFSLYSLELFEWSKRWNPKKFPKEKINEWWRNHEFELIKNILKNWWYNRYEISNYSLPWFESTHNLHYRDRWYYLAFGPWASGCMPINFWIYDLKKPTYSIDFRRTNTKRIDKFINYERVDQKSIEFVTESQRDVELFFLWLRRGEWIKIENLKNILSKNFESTVKKYAEEWILNFENGILSLTDYWMDISNHVISDLLA